ncbi:helix-turn-helix transcriptional regulator [Spongiibacter sp. KMU-158]|uniref:Helix-turn-helix transcriptional regulator n=1 Tax=Spongiibacter pelagi TaxID=2760804 RepID=A0A927C1I5_9GAMM|nr:helix-turn-helix transcriptional regulator [Spongiibacter pelagi]MBD2859559.1 helix-turn-helix transcriptional regulator [Spongiibacter pelagi]
MLIDSAFERLLTCIYQGPLEDEPWQGFLAELYEQMHAVTVTLVLNPPSEKGRGVLRVVGGRKVDSMDHYQERLFAMDPFRSLRPGEVRSLLEMIPPDEWINSELYNLCMKPVGLHDSMGLDIVVPGEMNAGLRVSRGPDSKPFDEQDKDLLRALMPHLERALRIHVRFNKTESERDLYAGAVESLSLATIILDENGKVLNCNRMAEQLIIREPEVRIEDGQLILGDLATTKKLQSMVDNLLASRGSEEPAVVEALRVSREGDFADLGVIARPVPASEWSEGTAVPTVAVFISDPEYGAEAPVKIIIQLFGFTPTEAQLSLLLADGLSLDEASEALGMSRNTARTHLRSIFSKTGVSRQTLLVRLILKSVAQLAE